MEKVAFFKYNFFNYLSLAFDLAYTRIFFMNSRLVRFPLYCRGHAFVSFGHKLTTGRFCRIDAVSSESDLLFRPYTPKIIFGSNVQIGDRVHLASAESVVIESNVLIASNVFISDHDHGTTQRASMDLPPMLRQLESNPVKIGHSCWIGQNVCILKGVELGHNCIVAAGAVVNRSFPPFSVIGGVPAKLLKQVA